MQQHIRRITAILLLLSACSSSTLPEAVQQSRKQEKNGKFREAEAILLTAEKKKPTDAVLTYHLGLLYERQFNELFKYSIKSITVNDPDFKPFGKAVRMRDQSGKELGYLIQDRTIVLETFLRAARKDPSYEAAWLAAANIAAEMNRFPRALSLLAQGISNLPASAKLPFFEGILRKHRGQFKEALQAFDRALQNDPDYTDARYQTADLLLQTGNSNDAERHLLKALQSDNEEKRKQRSALRLLRHYFKQQEYNRAASWAVRADKYLMPVPAAQRLAAISCFLANQDDQAERYARLYLKSKPENRVMLSILGKIALNRNKPKAAAEILEKALRKERTPQLLYQLGLIYLDRLQQPLKARQLLEETVKQRPLHSKALFALARAVEKNGAGRTEQTAAWKNYLRAVQKLKGSPLYSAERSGIRTALAKLKQLQQAGQNGQKQ